MNTVTERLRVVVAFRDETAVRPFDAQPIDLIRWLSSHGDWSYSTRATYHSYLRAYYNWLCLMDHRADNPMMVRTRFPTLCERVPRPVADGDLVGLLATPMHRRTRVMILLAALAVMRVGEIARVRGEDIDISAPEFMS